MKNKKISVNMTTMDPVMYDLTTKVLICNKYSQNQYDNHGGHLEKQPPSLMFQWLKVVSTPCLILVSACERFR